MIGVTLALAFLVQTDPGPVGTRITVEAAATSSSYHNADIVYAPATDQYLSAYTDQDASSNTVLRARFIHAGGGTVGAPIDIETSYAWAGYPSIAWNPVSKRFLVAFVAWPDPEGGAVVRGSILDPSGAHVGAASSFEISLPDPYGQEQVRVASDGSGWLVVWTHAEYPASIRGRIVDAAATNDIPLFGGDPFIIREADCHGPVVAAARGSGYLVAWNEPVAVGPDIRDGVLDCRVSSDGLPLGTVYRVDETVPWLGVAPRNRAPSIASNPWTGEFVVGWVEYWDAGATSGYPLARRIQASGEPFGSARLLSGSRGDATRTCPDSVAVTWNRHAGQYFAAWFESVRKANGTFSDYNVHAARIDGTTFSVLGTGMLLAEGVRPAGSQAGPSLPSAAARGTGFEVIVQWQNDKSPFPVEAQRCDLGPPPGAPSTTDQAQVDLVDGTSPIPPGGTVAPTGFVATSRLVHPEGLESRFEAEVRKIGIPFTGVATAIGPWTPSGATATLAISGLERGAGYHWQGRAVDAAGKACEWFCFGTDPDDGDEPDVRIRSANGLPGIAAAGQHVMSGSAAVPVGGSIIDVGMGFGVDPVADPDGDLIRVEVEVGPVARPFTGEPTGMGGWEDGAGPLSVVANLGEGSYHWRFRMTDSALESTAWISFGGNAESETDFALDPRGSRGAARICGQSAGAGAPRIAFMVLLFITLYRRNT